MPTTYWVYEVKLVFDRVDGVGERAWIDASNPLGDVASLTSECMSLSELRTNVEDLKKKLDDAVRTAERKFTGIHRT
jgi:hypothetical protein